MMYRDKFHAGLPCIADVREENERVKGYLHKGYANTPSHIK